MPHLEAAANARDVPIGTISANMNRAMLETRSQAAGTDLLRLWRAAERSLAAYEQLYTEEGDALVRGGCMPHPPTYRGRIRGLARSDAATALDRFLTEYRRLLAVPAAQPAADATSGSAPAAAPQPELLAPERTEIVGQVARYFAPTTAPHLVTHLAFEAKYVNGADAAFVNDTLAAAKAHMRPAANCQELIDKGLAASGA
jgi:hypothetical protein